MSRLERPVKLAITLVVATTAAVAPLTWDCPSLPHVIATMATWDFGAIGLALVISDVRPVRKLRRLLRSAWM